MSLLDGSAYNKPEGGGDRKQLSRPIYRSIFTDNLDRYFDGDLFAKEVCGYANAPTVLSPTVLSERSFWGTQMPLRTLYACLVRSL